MKTIGKLAKSLDITVETIRYYEREGLICQPIKPEVGYRLYSSKMREQLKFIINAKALGFTLKEIAALMSMDGDCEQVASLGLQKLSIIRNKISNLQRLEKVISDMTTSCKSNTDQASCPSIDSLK